MYKSTTTAFFLVCFLSISQAQIMIPKIMPGVKEISIFSLNANQVIPENGTPATLHSYDEQGRLVSTEMEWATISYTYSGDTVTKEIYSKSMEEVDRREVYTIVKNDSGYTKMIHSLMIMSMADGGYKISEVDYSDTFSFLPERIACDSCAHHSEIRVLTDEDGRFLRSTRYFLRDRYGSKALIRKEITTREYISDSLYIERRYETGFRDNFVLSVLSVKDIEGGILFRKYIGPETLEAFDTQELHAYQPLSYTVDNHGNWIEQFQVGKEKKTARRITYRE